MSPTIVVVGDVAADVARTTDSIRAHPALAAAPVIVRPADDPSPWSAIADGALLFVRAGDRLCVDGVTAVLASLDRADIVLGGHRVAGRGHWGVDVAPPQVDDVEQLAAWAVAPPFELSTIAVHRRCLPHEVHPAPGLPGGELALLQAALAASQRPVSTCPEIVADVRIRPEHTGDVAATLARLRGALTGPLGSDRATASAVRKRALSLAYLESGSPGAAAFDPDTWWGPALTGADPGAALDVVRDLQWALTCLADAHRLLVTGVDGLARNAVTDITAAAVPDHLGPATTIQSLHLMVAELTDTVRWLHQEVRHRDEQIAAHTAAAATTTSPAPPAPATPPPGASVDDVRTVDLARILRRRVRAAVGRRLRRRQA